MMNAKAILDHLEGKELESETTLRHLHSLNGLLLNCDDHAIERLEKGSPHLIQKRSEKGIRYLTEDKLNEVRKAAREVTGWKGDALRLLTAAYTEEDRGRLN